MSALVDLGGVRSEPPTPPAANADAVAAARALFADLQEALERVLGFGATAPCPWPELASRLTRAGASLEASDDLFWLAHSPQIPDAVPYLAFHHARLTVLAMRIGGRLGLDAAHLQVLGLAAMLVDIGLAEVREAVLRGATPPSPAEQTLLQTHPRRSAEIVGRWSPPLPGVIDLIAQHHERGQGQGYPQGLAGDAINPTALILGLVDAYAQMTALPAGRPQFRPHEAMRETVKSRHRGFPPAIVKALLSEITIFPPGSRVCLSTGEVGTVVQVNRRHPLRPQVMVDARSREFVPTAPKFVDLAETPFIFVNGAAEGS